MIDELKVNIKKKQKSHTESKCFRSSWSNTQRIIIGFTSKTMSGSYNVISWIWWTWNKFQIKSRTKWMNSIKHKPDELIKDLVIPKSELFNSANDSDLPMLTKLSIDASKRIICWIYRIRHKICFNKKKMKIISRSKYTNSQKKLFNILTPPLLAASLTAWMIADNKKASEFVNKDIYKLI